MDIIPLTTTPVNFGWAIIIALLGVGILIASGVLRENGDESPVRAGFGSFGIVVVMVAFAVAVLGSGGHEDWRKWMSDVKAAAADTYGIKLTSAEVSELGFPTEEPDEDFVVYGTISETTKSGDGYDRHDITLIWDDGELLLASSVDGDEFTELSR